MIWRIWRSCRHAGGTLPPMCALVALLNPFCLVSWRFSIGSGK